MSTRRRAKRKSIGGNISDIDRRLRSLEARPYPKKLSSKVVATKNVALRAVEEQLLADNAITKRTIADSQVVTAALSKVDDEEGAAVTTATIGDAQVTDAKIESLSTSKLDGLVLDGQIDSLSTTKLDGLIVDDQIDTMSTSKLDGLVLDDQIDSLSAEKITSLVVDDQLDGMSTEKLIGFVLDDQIDSLSAEKITGQLTNDQIEGIEGEKIIGGIDGGLINEGTVDTFQLADNAVTNEKIEAYTIQGARSGASVVTSRIVSSSIGYTDLAENIIFNKQIVTAVVFGRGAGPIGGYNYSITNASIGEDDMAANSIGSLEIKPGGVESSNIANLAVENRHIAAGAITTSKINNGEITAAKIEYNTSIITDVTGGNGIAVNLSARSNGKNAGISCVFGTGVNTVAVGNHTHTASNTVPAHTHPISFSESTGSGGTHSGHSTPQTNTGAHGHTFTVNGNTQNNTSTLKLKKEISDYIFNDPKKLLDLKLKRYKYKNEVRRLQEDLNREWMYGYLAEDLQDLGIEEVIGYDENKDPISLNYGLLSTLTIELLKVQQNEIDSLKEEIQRLKEKI